MTSSGQVRTFSGVVPSPFKLRKFSPLRRIPGGDTVFAILPDLMHCFNIGFGGDLAASGLMALCRTSFFGDGNIQTRLDKAFDEFDNWCHVNKKTASIKSFEMKKFKAKKTFELCLGSFSILYLELF